MAKRKQKLSFYLEFPAWLSVRDHAIRSGKTVTDVLLEWIMPHLAELPPSAAESSTAAEPMPGEQSAQ